MATPAAYLKLKDYYYQLMPALTAEGWQICEDVLSVRTIKKGSLLQKQGTICKHVSFINHGLVRMYSIHDEKEKVVEFFKEGEYTSDYRSFLMREPSLTAIQALEDTEVVQTTYDDLQMIYRKVPEANMIGRLIAENMFIDMCLKTSGVLGDSIEVRYSSLIEEMPWLLQRVPQYLIASYLGITPEALSRMKARTVRKTPKLELV